MNKNKQSKRLILSVAIIVVFTYLPTIVYSFACPTDSIAPTITKEADDEIIGCGLSDPLVALQSWYDFAGAMSATDDVTDNGDINYFGEPSYPEVVAQFNQNIICGESRSVTVNFFARDTCGNISLPSEATFTLLDDRGPEIISNAQPITQRCDNNSHDSLKVWVANHGNAIAEDLCGNVQWLRYAYSDNQGNSGTGFLNNDTIPIPNEFCNWRVTVSFIAIDDCGNQSVTTSNFTLFDAFDPSFNKFPGDTIISCEALEEGFGVVGIDNCTKNPLLTIIDTTTQSDNPLNCEFYNFNILRTYIVEDACGNTATYQHNIEVFDATGPSFEEPMDTIVDCSIIGIDETGIFPQNIADNCSDVLVSVNDSIVGEGCEYSILRTYILTDVCGNTSTTDQLISVVDTTPPEINDSDLSYQVSCITNNLLSFDDFLNQPNGLITNDNCSNVLFFAADPGSYDPSDTTSFPGTLPSLEFENCGLSRKGFLLYKEVDFVFYDQCGNTLVVPAVYAIEDDQPPIIESCIPDTILIADTLGCTANFTLPKISTFDDCVILRDEIVLTGRSEFESLDANDPESPIRTIVIELSDFTPFFLNINEDVIFEVNIDMGDVDEPNEYLTIISETGDSLGITPFSEIECGSASITYTLAAEDVTQWMQDRVIRFLFIQTGERTINNICEGGGIDIKLTIKNEIISNKNITLIDGIPLSSEDFIDENTIVIPPGKHIITQIVEDCAGNRDSCSYNVSILDTIPPVISCPDDFEIFGESVDCTITTKIPLDLTVSDNCILNGAYAQTLPAGENNLLTFSSPGGDLASEANEVVVAFTGVNPIRYSELPIKLLIDVQADINDANELFEIIGEENTSLGFLGNTGGEECGRFKEELTIDREVFNAWSADGVLELKFDPLTSSDGINPCGSLMNDGTDGISFLNATLSYSDAVLEYKIEGLDTIPRSQLVMGTDSIDLSVSAGENVVTIYSTDQSGNIDSCSFMVTVKDNVAPIAQCQQTVLFVDPAGINDLIVKPEDINNGSTDNCGIDSMRVSPNLFACEDIGQEIDVTLFIYDESGNQDSCTTQVAIRAPILEPYFELDVCTNDTLRLFANVPPAPIPNAYSFRWSGPFFSSFSENPVITNVSGTNNGTYMLEVIGFDGCVSSGTVDVNITEVISPTIITEQSEVCRGESLLLTTNGLSGNVTYNWYQGIHPNGLLLEKTVSPSYLIMPVEEETFYYVIIEQNGCESNPSAGKQVNIVDAPQVSVLEEFISVCEGEAISFGTNVFGNNYEYFWFGPNQFSSDKQFPDTIFNVTKANEGTYSLFVSISNCVSDTTNLLVTVFDKPITPEINANEIFCEGSSVGLTINNIPNGDQYIWYLNDVEYSRTATNTLIISNATEALSGNWTAEVSDGICMSDLSEPVPISVESELIISANNSGPGCSGDSINLLTSFVPNATYTWTGPNGFSSNLQNPKILPAPGEYSISITTENGCNAEASTTVSVVDPAEITALSSNAMECVDGTSDISFFPSIFPAGNYSYVWTGPNGFSSDVLNPIINNVTSSINGRYTLEVVSGACNSAPRSIDINVIDIPDKPVITGNLNYCQGDDIILSTQMVSNATNYLWNTPLGQRFTDAPELIIPSIEEDDAGVYSVSVQAGNCRSEVSNQININVDNLSFDPVVSYNGPLCPGDTLRLSSTFLDGVQYRWQGPNGFLSTEQNPIVEGVTEDFSGVYTLLVSQGSCVKESEELSVEIISEINAPIVDSEDQSYCSLALPSQIDICLNQSSQINGAEYILFNGMDNSEVSRSINLCQTINNIENLQTGQNLFYIRIDQSGCLSEASEMFIVTIEEPPIVDAEIEETELMFCDETSVNLTSSFGLPEVSLTWTALSSNLVAQVTGERTVEISNLITGDNEVQLTYSTDLCPDFSSTTIVIRKEEASIIRNDNYNLTEFNEVLLDIFSNDDLSDDITYEIIQQPIAGSVLLDDNGARFTPDIRFAGTTTFIYEVCDINCAGECQQATVTLNVGDDGDCTSPTIITPNGDGYNDFFVVPCLTSGNFGGNKLTIFNQWGVVIIEQENYQNNWAGTYNGDDLPVGTYFYILDLGDNSDPIVGFLTLER